MAVGATNLALGELVNDGRPGKPALNQLVQLQPFRAWLDVIELEDQRILQTTVDARVVEQVLPQTPLPLDAARSQQLTVSFNVREAISTVVLPPVSSEALTANVLAGASLLVSVVKAVCGLVLMTPRARAHGYSPSPKCSFAQPNWAAVRRRWQFAHLTSHC
jgi:hypothetical protein